MVRTASRSIPPLGSGIRGTHQPLLVAEVEVGCKARLGLPDRLVALQVDLLVLHGPPEALEEDVVPHPAAAVHAYPDPGAFKPPGELSARELAPLVAVEDAWP